MSRLPPVTQFSYVVDDLDAAIEHWTRVMQVGPFFVLEHVPYARCLYRGEPSPIDMSVALAYTGEVQVELVTQHNDAPSIFRDFLQQRGPGLQHVGALSEDLDAHLALLAAEGVRPVQEGEAQNGTRFVYVDSDRIAGTMLELFQVPDDIARAFAYMREAAHAWRPGEDPPRRG